MTIHYDDVSKVVVEMGVMNDNIEKHEKEEKQTPALEEPQKVAEQKASPTPKKQSVEQSVEKQKEENAETIKANAEKETD